MKKIIILLFLISCSHPIPIFLKNPKNNPAIQCVVPMLWSISRNVPRQYHETIIEGVRYWNEVLGKKIFIYIGEVDMSPFSLEAGGFIIIGADYMSKNTCATITYTFSPHSCIAHSRVLISERCLVKDKEYLESAVRHEFGHILGLNHGAWGNVMFYKLDESFQHPLEASELQINMLKIIYNLED